MDQILKNLTLEKFYEYEQSLETELDKFPIIQQVEQKYKIKKSYVVYGTVGLALLLITFNVFGQLVTNIVGFLYPAYMSYLAIESPQKDDDVQWLTYWLVYALFSIAEYFTDILVYWIPFYFLLKTIFLVFLWSPYTKGAVLIYEKYVRNIFMNITTQISHIKENKKE